MIKQGVILASGLGSRLNSKGRNEPKPLMPVGGVALIERVIILMRLAGIEKIVVVVGYRGDQVVDFIKKKRIADVVFVKNEEYNKKNGISLLRAREALDDAPFLLSMSDHVFSNDFLDLFLQAAEPKLSDFEVLLSVDRNIEAVFDLDDATKVFTEGMQITRIGKELGAYNGVDTGLFLCKHGIFDKLQKIYDETGDVSISDGMKALIDDKQFAAIETTGRLWQDVDTPSMKREAEERLLNDCLNKEKSRDFFSNNFFFKIAEETALYFFKKERFDWKIIDSCFLICSILLSALSLRLNVVFPTIISLFAATSLYFFNNIKHKIKIDEPFEDPLLFSYKFYFVISIIPVILSTNIIFACVVLILMMALILAKFFGFYEILHSQTAEIPVSFVSTYLSPSLFLIIYAVSVIFFPNFITALLSLIFLLFHVSTER